MQLLSDHNDLTNTVKFYSEPEVFEACTKDLNFPLFPCIGFPYLSNHMRANTKIKLESTWASTPRFNLSNKDVQIYTFDLKDAEIAPLCIQKKMIEGAVILDNKIIFGKD